MPPRSSSSVSSSMAPQTPQAESAPSATPKSSSSLSSSVTTTRRRNRITPRTPYGDPSCNMRIRGLCSSTGSVGTFLFVFSFLLYITAPRSVPKETDLMATSLQKRHEEHRSEKLPEIDMSCNLRTLQVPKHKMEPTFLSSYPGSGTKLQWELVEALTGVPTTDDAFSNGHHNVVGIKTHYPCPAGREFPGAETIQRAIIFVRHPMDTIAAYHLCVREQSAVGCGTAGAVGVVDQMEGCGLCS